MKFKQLLLLKKLLMYSFYTLLIQLVCCSILFATGSTKAQKPVSVKNIKINVKFKNDDLISAFKKIEKRTNFFFLYNESDLDTDVKISGYYSGQSLYSVLLDISGKSKLSFKQINKNINVKKIKSTNQLRLESAQNQVAERMKVSGRVTDENGEGLPGASIIEKGTTNGTITDRDGNYILTVSDNAVLVISYVGYINQEISLGGRTTIDVQMTLDAEQLKEVVVIGYGVQDKRDVTTSIASISSEELKNQPVVSFDQAIVGKIAGVQVTEPSGEPGVGLRIRIRGTSSITAGNDPLYVIDGVPMNGDFRGAGGTIRRPNGRNGYGVESVSLLSSINVNDIESIEILKDASAAAIYGSRGSNGVVLISTKKGNKGKPQISYNVYGGIQQVSKKIDLLDAYEFAELVRDGHNNTYLDAVPRGSISDDNETREANGSPSSGLLPDFIQPYLSGQQGLTDTDWQDAVFRTAPIQSHNFSISGGDKNTTYFGSVNYMNQEGVVINSDYKQYSIRLNVSTKLSDKLRFGFNLNPSHEVANRINKGPHWSEGIVALALANSPNFPVFNADGSYNWDRNQSPISDVGDTRFLNPVALAQEIKNETSHDRLIGNVYGEWDILKNFQYQISAGFDLNRFTRDYYRPSVIEDRNTGGQPSVPDAYARDDQYSNWVIEHTISYNKTLGDHNIAAIMGFSSQMEKQRNNETYATNFPNDLATTTNAGQVVDAGSTLQEWSLMSYLGRVQYDFKGKYLVSAAIRFDGSSRFGENNRWGYFPSISAGWRVSNEEFFNSQVISDLKLRGSFGVTGNFQIPNYGAFGLISENNYLDASGNVINGLALSTSANHDLKWERTKTVDIGLDIGLLEDNLYFELDYYKSTTSDLLLNVPVSALSGFTSTLINIGEIENTGWEATISGNAKIGQVEIDAALNFATNQNKVLALGSDNADIIVSISGGGGYSFITRVGEEIGSYYALKTDGILTQSDIDNGVAIFAGSKAGDIKNVDINGDKVINNAGDRTILGSPFPDYTLGLRATLKYKNFDFRFAIQSVQGFEVNALINRYNYNVEGNFNNVAEVMDRYRSESNPGSGINPRANRQSKGSLGAPSDRHIEDGSYTRIRNLTLGYRLPAAFLEKYLDRSRVYLSVQNPFTFTDYRYYNPEVSSTPDNALTGGQDYGNYPLTRTFTLGVSLTFK